MDPIRIGLLSKDEPRELFFPRLHHIRRPSAFRTGEQRPATSLMDLNEDAPDSLVETGRIENSEGYGKSRLRGKLVESPSTTTSCNREQHNGRMIAFGASPGPPRDSRIDRRLIAFSQTCKRG